MKSFGFSVCGGVAAMGRWTCVLRADCVCSGCSAIDWCFIHGVRPSCALGYVCIGILTMYQTCVSPRYELTKSDGCGRNSCEALARNVY